MEQIRETKLGENRSGKSLDYSEDVIKRSKQLFERCETQSRFIESLVEQSDRLIAHSRELIEKTRRQ